MQKIVRVAGGLGHGIGIMRARNLAGSFGD